MRLPSSAQASHRKAFKLNQPEIVLSRPGSKRRWMWPLAGLALIAVVVGLCLLNNLRHSSAPSVVQNSVTNEPAPVSLADFADVQTQVWRSVPRGTQVCDGVTFIC